MFDLNSKLAADTIFIADLKLSRLLLMNDANYLWLILVPRKPGLSELIDLTFEEQVELLGEINLLSRLLKSEFECDKLNIANLGNMVRQLHIHVIARRENDATFPKPVWGNAAAKPYNEEAAQKLITKIKSLL